MRDRIVVLGIFAADAAFRADRMPRIGETILGNGFALGPGGKGSNQAVAAARAGGRVHFISRIGDDTFGRMALDLWAGAGVTPEVTVDPDAPTGAASIFVHEGSGDNAIIVCPGASARLSPADVEARAELIRGAAVFITQLEQPLAAARRGLELAREGGAVTILNPAPAAELPDDLLALCDIVTPNESEAEALTGRSIASLDDARAAAAALMARGAGAALITLGAQGALYHDAEQSVHVPVVSAGPVVETTGAGDAFNGGFVAGLARGLDRVAAARLGCATAGLSVTRAGAAASMPTAAEIEAVLARQS